MKFFLTEDFGYTLGRTLSFYNCSQKASAEKLIETLSMLKDNRLLFSYGGFFEVYQISSELHSNLSRDMIDRIESLDEIILSFITSLLFL